MDSKAIGRQRLDSPIRAYLLFGQARPFLGCHAKRKKFGIMSHIPITFCREITFDLAFSAQTHVDFKQRHCQRSGTA